jgi:hypothetical protein
MHETGLDRVCSAGSARRIPRTIILAFFLLTLLAGLTPAWAEDAKQAAPPPPAPSAGKALVYIYRVGRFVGSASHDHLYLNGIYWAYLKNSEYAWMEVDPGNVSVTGSTEMYYAGGITMSSYAAIKNGTKKENERIKFDAEAGKTYYMKWTSEALGTGVKVTMMDSGQGAKEMSKLHLSSPVEQPVVKPDEPSGTADKPAGASQPDNANKDAGK